MLGKATSTQPHSAKWAGLYVDLPNREKSKICAAKMRARDALFACPLIGDKVMQPLSDGRGSQQFTGSSRAIHLLICQRAVRVFLRPHAKLPSV